MAPRETIALVLALAAAGCAGGTRVVRSTGPRTVQHVPHNRIHGPFVAEGTEFVVRLNQPISTKGSRVGQTFTARLETPLRTPDGTVPIPAGANVTGRVAELDWGRRPLIRLEFSTIESNLGSLPLNVAVQDADRIVYRGEERVALPPVRRNTGTAVFEPTFGRAYQHSLGSPGGGYGVPTYIGHPREALLQTDAWIRLVLTRPLLPPGTTVDATGR